MKKPFIHLKVHSEFAIEDSLIRINELVDRCVKLGYPSIAITDPHHMFSAIKFFQAAIKKGIKPIFGADLYIKRQDEKIYPITVLCKNDEGYKNLSQMISLSHTQKTEINPICIDFETFQKNYHGLIVLSGGKDGDIGQALLNHQHDKAVHYLHQWKSMTGNDFFLELQRHDMRDEENYIHLALSLAKESQTPIVATHNVRFLDPSDFEAHEARVCIHDGEVLNNPKRAQKFNASNHLPSPEQMAKRWQDLPSAIENTYIIAKKCNLKFELGINHLPLYPVPQTHTLESYLKEQSEIGLNQYIERCEKTWDETKIDIYQKRLDHELSIINRMGFPGYFLIVADFIAWSKENDIPVGPGRGSGAGSLVAFCLAITALDPIEYELLFERFLNPERVSLPDFDVDFCMEGRDRVIDYVTEKYGQPCVSQIITYGTMAAKAVIRDAGRALGHPYGFVDALAKLIPFEIGITLEKALTQEEALDLRYRNEDEVKNLIDLAMKLEGLTRNAGKHAGGVVIAPKPINQFCPLYQDPKNPHPVTQFDKNDCESIGLVKFDFLGLRTLTIIKWALKLINHCPSTNEKVAIENIALDDKKTFDLLKSCQTTAVFQLESRGMKELIRRLQPDCFEDIIALVALFRPGPLQSGMVDDFILRKHGLEPIIYPHPWLEETLKPTYGVILYQEQVMQIAQILAGYSLGEADLLRRAMGKKKPEEMAKQREIFVSGALKKSIDSKTSNSIFDLMEKFAGYGFNKSHSAAYALIAYQTAWLKAHYPSEFMAATLSSDMDNTDKTAIFIKECQDIELPLLPPNLNQGEFQFTVTDKKEICFGLGAIKGAGEAALNALITERSLNGPFNNFFELCERIDHRKINKRVLEALVQGGALDVIHNNRQCLFHNIGKALKYADQCQKNQAQADLFAMGGQSANYPSLNPTPQWSEQEQMKREKATLGFYATGHPLHAIKHELNNIATHPIAKINGLESKQPITIAGILTQKRLIKTKRGKLMAVLHIEDLSSSTDVTLFSEALDESQKHLVIDNILIITGEVSFDKFSNGNRVSAQKICGLNEFRKKHAQGVLITLKKTSLNSETLNKLISLLKHSPRGRSFVRINYSNEYAQGQLEIKKRKYDIQDDFLHRLKQLIKEDAISVLY